MNAECCHHQCHPSTVRLSRTQAGSANERRARDEQLCPVGGRRSPASVCALPITVQYTQTSHPSVHQSISACATRTPHFHPLAPAGRRRVQCGTEGQSKRKRKRKRKLKPQSHAPRVRFADHLLTRPRSRSAPRPVTRGQFTNGLELHPRGQGQSPVSGFGARRLDSLEPGVHRLPLLRQLHPCVKASQRPNCQGGRTDGGPACLPACLTDWMTD
ncbi:hypothetical protein MPTK1_2g17660 [Marchantia polymorpha subsp. ruderalis]|uniref:Uncharacterized protein n=1 Tax=Marchantia polymorpha TaxID=3197 RepID=A0A2R6WG77_MARPO|nr:hypothetical protein MARPO_0094s0034 [Marchantia polymorpha]BBN02734.1 hypothetical protein Mp_2g17660 [Marchantia polymorpha subsp. ruderalis]|eukprot:PTQ32859.1 hypothetical protein MARPO_0094s0034 [Marchantia polymorpha]